MAKLPISVVVPISRRRFFEGFTLPMLEANGPEEIIIIGDDGSVGMKRNRGAKQAKNEFLLFCDDDVIVQKDCLDIFLTTLLLRPKASFVYSNFLIVNLHPECTPQFTNTFMKGIDWDVEQLKQDNYISSCSLLRTSDFVEFDENLPMLEDWDLWLTMAEQGKEGTYLNETLFLSFRIDKSLSYKMPHKEARKLVLAKHGLI